MAEELVNVTIDGIAIAVPKGTTIIEAAKQAGVLVPHYCYHPSLPSPAVCRMCLVEVEKAPKLMPACVTTVAEGQVVHVNSDKAKKAREGVLEFLLINHPLDCPICDQAGECELQDYVFQEGRAGTRYAEYAKRFNPVEDFGPDVLYVPNRCILCTRCVRFMEDVAQDARAQRLGAGRPRVHRHRRRTRGSTIPGRATWSISARSARCSPRTSCTRRGPGTWTRRASVCPGCTQGCNISIDTRDDVVVRLRPRPNLEVNRHFICDYGRMNYRWMNRGDRIEAPLVREGGRHVATDWDVGAGPARPAGARRLRQGRHPGLGPGIDRVAGPGPQDGRSFRRHRRRAGPLGRRGATRRGAESRPAPRARAQPQGRGAARVHDQLGARPAAKRSMPRW